MPSNIYRQNLDRNPANYTPLTPLSFLARTVEVYPGKTAVIHGDRCFTYAELGGRCRRLASALAKRGIGEGDTVAIMAPNIPAMLEAHFGVPMSGAVINCLNTRLDAATIAFCLKHGEAKILITDSDYADVVEAALNTLDQPITVTSGSTTPLLVDFDVAQSFVLRGNSLAQNGLLFKPVIRGPKDRLYFGVGSATNSGIVGLDNIR